MRRNGWLRWTSVYSKAKKSYTLVFWIPEISWVFTSTHTHTPSLLDFHWFALILSLVKHEPLVHHQSSCTRLNFSAYELDVCFFSRVFSTCYCRLMFVIVVAVVAVHCWLVGGWMVAVIVVSFDFDFKSFLLLIHPSIPQRVLLLLFGFPKNSGFNEAFRLSVTVFSFSARKLKM